MSLETLTLDIVVPVFNESENIREFYRRTSIALECTKLSWRIVFVNDGSDDNSRSIIEALPHEPNRRITLVNLSRNFGHQAAITAGISESNADALVIIDGDLQDPPELIVEMVERWRSGYDVVVAKRKSRKDKGLRRVGFEIFHRSFASLSDFPIEPNTGVYSLISKPVVDEMKSLSEHNRFLPGLRDWIGYRKAEVLYDRQERSAGEAKQKFSNLFGYALDAVFSFSYKPLRMMTYLGSFICICAFTVGFIFIAKRVMGIEVAETGFTTLVTLITFLGGIQLMALGVLGEYIGRIYNETKNRPIFIVKSIDHR